MQLAPASAPSVSTATKALVNVTRAPPVSISPLWAGPLAPAVLLGNTNQSMAKQLAHSAKLVSLKIQPGWNCANPVLLVSSNHRTGKQSVMHVHRVNIPLQLGLQPLRGAGFARVESSEAWKVQRNVLTVLPPLVGSEASTACSAPLEPSNSEMVRMFARSAHLENSRRPQPLVAVAGIALRMQPFQAYGSTGRRTRLVNLSADHVRWIV